MTDHQEELRRLRAEYQSEEKKLWKLLLGLVVIVAALSGTAVILYTLITSI